MAGIKGLLETSFLDWPGRLCAVLFLGGCNFRCPFCHNHPLVLAPDSFPALSVEEIEQRLTGFRAWLGGICISGGEPTLDPELIEMIGFLKGRGWAVKLDTNGSRPEVLARLLEAGMLDMVAMDVKAPLVAEKYARCAGMRVDLNLIRESIRLLAESGIDHEFRMTVLPSFHAEADVRQWAATLGGGHGRLRLQNFNPRTTTLDPGLEREKEFTPEEFEKLAARIRSQEKSSGKLDKEKCL